MEGTITVTVSGYYLRVDFDPPRKGVSSSEFTSVFTLMEMVGFPIDDRSHLTDRPNDGRRFRFTVEELKGS